MSVVELIKNRRSFRTYDDQPLSQEDLKVLQDYINAQTNPFGVFVDTRILDVNTYGLKSPVIVGEHTYIGAKVKRVQNFEIAFGYSFEKLCLFALSQGMGTVMLASTLNRSAFEKALDVKDDEVMPLASPVGYPAKKMSMRETMMRKGIKADDRKPFESLFFNKDFNTSLTQEAAGEFYQALEMARWAPSAANVQPWRIVVDGNNVHFYEAKTMKTNSLGDIQKVDIGIALAHFELVLEEAGIKGSYTFDNPNLQAPENYEYMVTYTKDM